MTIYDQIKSILEIETLHSHKWIFCDVALLLEILSIGLRELKYLNFYHMRQPTFGWNIIYSAVTPKVTSKSDYVTSWLTHLRGAVDQENPNFGSKNSNPDFYTIWEKRSWNIGKSWKKLKKVEKWPKNHYLATQGIYL